MLSNIEMSGKKKFRSSHVLLLGTTARSTVALLLSFSVSYPSWSLQRNSFSQELLSLH